MYVHHARKPRTGEAVGNSAPAGCLPTLHVHSRRDPTRTTLMRARYERALVRRFRALAAEVKTKVIEDDAFGLKEPVPMLATNLRDFDFETLEEKVAAFRRWIRDRVGQTVMEVQVGTPMLSAARRSWQNLYLRSAYQAGLSQSAGNMRSAGATVSDRWVDAAFYRPIHADAVGLIFTRAFSELEGITEAMDRRMSRSLADSLVRGDGARQTARALTQAVEDIGITRARMLARTETIAAHAESTLNAYTEAKLEGVRIQSEFSTAGDDHVCLKCAALEGTTFTLESARGIIPVHPNCRCAWLPVVSNPRGIELL